MKKLAISQRVDEHEDYAERRDGLDQRWYELADELGCAPLPLPNIDPGKVAAHLQLIAPDAIVLSGGNAVPERDAFESALLDWALARKVPVLGICHGMQFVNEYFGGSCSEVSAHVAQRHQVTFVGELADVGSLEVNSYHNFGIAAADVAACFAAAAIADDGTVEAIAHTEEAVAALMWHPERESPFSEVDLQLFRKYLAL